MNVCGVVSSLPVLSYTQGIPELMLVKPFSPVPSIQVRYLISTQCTIYVVFRCSLGGHNACLSRMRLGFESRQWKLSIFLPKLETISFGDVYRVLFAMMKAVSRVSKLGLNREAHKLLLYPFAEN